MKASQGQSGRTAVFFRLMVAVLLLVAIVAFVDTTAILSSAFEANVFLIVVAVAILPVNLLLEAVKWRVLLSGCSIQTGTRESFGSVLAGYTLGFLTPARVGDYAGRVLYLSEPRKGLLLVVAALDRLYSFWIYAFAGTVILGFQLEGSLPGPSGVWWVTFALGLALVVGVGIIIASPSSGHAMIRSLLRGRWARRWQRHSDATRAIQPPTRFAMLLLSALRYGVFSTQFVLLVLAFSPESPALTLYVGVALVFFAKTVIPSISFFDLGVRESAAIFFLGIFGVAPSAALNASLLLFAVNVALPALIGITFVPRLKWTRLGLTPKKVQAVEAGSG